MRAAGGAGCALPALYPCSALLHLHTLNRVRPTPAACSCICATLIIFVFARDLSPWPLITGSGFHKSYVDLLRDTGRMSAEEVVAKHLKTSIEETSFWRGSIRIVERKLDAFEAALEKLGL